MVRAWWWVLAAAVAVQDTPAPVPDASAQKGAEQLVREVFKEQFAKTGPADRHALARTLLDQAKAADNTPATRYVLLREAQGLGDLETSFQAVDLMAQSFVVDPVALKLTTLAGLEAKTPEELKAFNTSALSLADEAVRSGDADAAEKAVQLALQNARKAKDLPGVTRSQSKGKEVSELRGRLDTVKKAQQVLATKPDDPAACAVAGLFECVFRGNWEKGLRLLAKGDQAGLRTIAAKELAGPAEPAAQIEAGDAWWDLAEKETGVPREGCRQRALQWYGAALPRLSGLTRAKVEARYREAGRVIPTEAGSRGPYALDSRGFVRNWLILGPFSNEGDRGFDADFLGGEAAAIPREGAEVPVSGSTPLKWGPYATDTERIDFYRVPHLGIQQNQPDLVVYAACWAGLDEDADLQLRLGSDDGNLVWLDHHELGRKHVHRRAEMDQEIYPLKLTRGKHLILVKVDQGNGDYQLMVRLVTATGDPAPGVRIWN